MEARQQETDDEVQLGYGPISPSSSSLFLFMGGASGSILIVPEVTFIMTLLFPAERWK